MWQGEKEISLRKMYTSGRMVNRRRQSMLDVTHRASHQGMDSHRLAVLVMFPFLLAGFVLLGMLIWNQWFVRSEQWMIRHVKVEGGKFITPELVAEWTGITEGLPLLGMSIRKTRELLLQRANNLSGVEIRRVFPDTVEIYLTERIPLARLAESRHLVVDREGIVFAQRADAMELSLLWGGAQSPVRPGHRVARHALPALDLLEVCRYGLRDGLDIRSVNVERPDYLLLKLGDGKEVKFAWESMEERTEASRMRLNRQLGYLAKAIRTRQSDGKMVVDATFPDRAFFQ